MPAFRAGDLDLSFAFRYADRHPALFASIEFVRIPLVPSLSQLLEKTLDLIDLLQEPEPFPGALHMVPGERTVNRINQANQADRVKKTFSGDHRNYPEYQK